MIIKIALDDGPTPISGNTIRGPPFGLGISANCLVLKRQDISSLDLKFILVFVEDVNGILTFNVGPGMMIGLYLAS